MSSTNSALNEELEEGEIKDEAFEDISECSLSDILTEQKDLEHDSDVEQLREEALKSLRDEDEVTEEQLYRLEALKSLLVNIESSEKMSPEKENAKKKRKRRKKAHQKAVKHFKAEDGTSKELECCSESFCNRTASFSLNGLSCGVDSVNKENRISNDSRLTRSWYPKIDSALLNCCDSVKKNNNLSAPVADDNFILVPEVLTVANADVQLAKPTITCRQVNRPKEDHCVRRLAPVFPTVSKVNHLTRLPASTFSRYKRVSSHHVRKYDSTLPTVNRFSLRRVHNGQYKIVNSSNYALKKSNLITARAGKPLSDPKSVYSINRIKQAPIPPASINSPKSSELIIKFDDEDSGKEDNDGSAAYERVESIAEQLAESWTKESSKNISFVDWGCEHNVESCSMASDDAVSLAEECQQNVEIVRASSDGETSTRSDSETVELTDGIVVTKVPILTMSTKSITFSADVVRSDGADNAQEDDASNGASIAETASCPKKDCDVKPTCSRQLPSDHASTIVERNVALVVKKREPDEENAEIKLELNERVSISSDDDYSVDERSMILLAEKPEPDSEDAEVELEPDEGASISNDDGCSVDEHDVFLPIEKREPYSDAEAELEPNERATASNDDGCSVDERDVFLLIETREPNSISKAELELDVMPNVSNENEETVDTGVVTPTIESCAPSPTALRIKQEPNDSEETPIQESAAEEPTVFTSIVKDEPSSASESELDDSFETIVENENTCGSTHDLTSNACENLFILANATAKLIQMRARLLFNLGELEVRIKKEAEDKDKLNIMLRKLIKLKSVVFKFEEKIKLHQSQLSVSSNSVHSLFKDVHVQMDECVRLKNVCIHSGSEIMGPEYKPPDLYEGMIDEKCKIIDFSKYSPSSTN